MLGAGKVWFQRDEELEETLEQAARVTFAEDPETLETLEENSVRVAETALLDGHPEVTNAFLDSLDGALDTRP